MTHDTDPPASGHYQIKVRGQLDPDWSDWFSGMTIVHEGKADNQSLTTLTGSITDQSALRGILHKLWDLNLVVHSVQLLDGSFEPHTEELPEGSTSVRATQLVGAPREEA
jgi:hypothetical protein